MPGTALTSTTDILKVDDALGVVFGYAIVCREKDAAGAWVDHYDTQGHHIPEDEMLKASVEFAQQTGEVRAELIAKSIINSLVKSDGDMDNEQVIELVKRASKDMHEGDDVQEVIQMLPVTEELAKALGWEVQQTGLVIALKPTADILALYKNDPASAPDFRTGFSMGGTGKLTEIAA